MARDLRKNPFMILGVSGDADMREIKQVAQRSLMENSLGGGEDLKVKQQIEKAL